MAFHKTYYSQLCSDIAALVYHFYLMGVKDGAMSGDEWGVRLVTEREDMTQSFQIMSAFSNKLISFETYNEFMQYQFSHIKPKAIQHWFLRVSGSYDIKNALVWICDEYYRKGLSDGLKTGMGGVDEFMSRNRGFAQIDERNVSAELFLISIKMVAITIKVERPEIADKMIKLIAFIASSIRKRRDYYLKIRNEEK